MADRLAGELRSAEGLEPRWTAARIAAYVVAAIVWLAGAGLIFTAVLLLVVAFPHPVAIGVALLLIMVGFLARPRFGSVPGENLVERSEAPTLHAVVDDVAAALETPAVDLIVVDHTYNASWAVLGLGRTRVLTLGLPLLTMLEPQERVALVAHELAHARNGDAGRGLVVGGALGALQELYGLLSPDEQQASYSELAIFDRITNILLWALSRPVLGLLYLQVFLLTRDSQRAEYLADALAARVAGSKAQVSLMEKLLLESTFRAAVQRASRDAYAGSAGDLFAELATRSATVPERELERRRRVARLEDARVLATHPPTARRIELVESRGLEQPLVVLDSVRSKAIDGELAGRRAALARLLVDDHRDSLYAR